MAQESESGEWKIKYLWEATYKGNAIDDIVLIYKPFLDVRRTYSTIQL